MVRAARLPLVFWLHDASDGQHWLERWARRTRPDFALCNSRFTGRALPNIYPNARAEVFYSPVAPTLHSYSKADQTATRAELQTPKGAVVIIQASRMEAWKGHALHLAALSVLTDLPDWVCWQVGGAQRPSEIQYLDGLKRTAARLGISERVRFLGQRSDVERLLAAGDLYCQPNLGPEPFGIALVEALHAQLPVVTTATGGACEIVDDSCGVLVSLGDAQALAASLRRLIEDSALRVKLGANGPARARELCDPAAQIERLGGLLASAAYRSTVLSIVQQEVTG